MLEPPVVVELEPMTIATVRITVPRSEIVRAMGPGKAELLKVVASQGLETTGPWFTHHFRMDPAVFDFEIGVPVARPVVPEGRVVPGARPAMRVARTVYRGPYDGLGQAWGEFLVWVAKAGHVGTDELWETYELGPETSADATTYRTRLERPLRGRARVRDASHPPS
ncbi:MAG: GyrI-like domain-containing protein [Polyangiales bacterium]